MRLPLAIVKIVNFGENMQIDMQNRYYGMEALRELFELLLII